MIIRVKSLPASKNNEARYKVSYRGFQHTYSQNSCQYDPLKAAGRMATKLHLHGHWYEMEVDRGPVRFYGNVSKLSPAMLCNPVESLRDTVNGPQSEFCVMLREE